MQITKLTNTALIALALISILSVVLKTSLYRVDESEYALELRFGKVKNVRTEPGLYPKAPFMDSISRIDKRTLRADIPARQVPDRDKERLIIDTVIRFQITDPLAFHQTLRTKATAKERLQNIVYSAMRDTIAEHDRTDVIGARPRLDDEGNPFTNEQGLTIYDSLVDTRDSISSKIQDRLAHAVSAQKYGITIISADIKRADFPSQIRSSIIDRLRAERQRVAARHRADGEEQYRRRTSAVQAEADILIAEAERDARQTRGSGEAQAIKIVQEALQEDNGFYTFLRAMESYETSIRPGSTIILTDTPNGYLSDLTRLPNLAAPGKPGK